MAKFTIRASKKSAKKSAGPLAKAKAADPIPSLLLLDNEDDTATVQGITAAGNPVDISAVATLAVTSSDTSKLTVDPPQGMTFTMHAAGPLTGGTPVNVEATATWNDGSKGPFAFTLPVEINPGPAGGIVIVPGVPVAH